MNTTSHEFSRLCDFVALSETLDTKELLNRLIESVLRQSTAVGCEEAFITAEIAQKYGLDEQKGVVHDSLLRLKQVGRVESSAAGFQLSAIRRTELVAAINKINDLESSVRTEWHEDVLGRYGEVDLNLLWTCLTDFLAHAIRFHGLETLSLLHPSSIHNGELTSSSLKKMLEEASGKFSTASEKPILRKAVCDFLVDAASKPGRAQLISQMASGTFSFLTLRIPPEVSSSLKKGLKDLTLYLDTNFIFCLLGLEHEEQVETSKSLINLIQKAKLPFKLRYHEATELELRRTLSAKKNYLGRRRWSKYVSAAAINSMALGGVDYAYHRKNSLRSVSVEDFFLPFEDVRQTLKNLGIELFRPHADLLEQRSTIEIAYADFLRHREIQREPAAVSHDATVLASVQLQRADASSSLDAKALFLTLDYRLFQWDSKSAKTAGSNPLVVLPHSMFLLLRPFTSDSADFDVAFSKSILIPELRLFEDAPSAAYERALSLLGCFENMSERQASDILSSKLLVTKIGETANDDSASELIKLEIAQREEEANSKAAALLMKNAQTEEQLCEARARQLEVDSQLQDTKDRLAKLEKLIATQNEKIAQESHSASALQIKLDEERLHGAQALEIERRANAANLQAQAEVHSHRMWFVGKLTLLLMIGGAFWRYWETITAWDPVAKVITDNNNRGFWGCLLVLSGCASWALLFAKHRKTVLIGGAVTFVGILLQIVK